jgi:hypothetical protein
LDIQPCGLSLEQQRTFAEEAMTKADTYRAQLRTLEVWDAWLQQESGLPGPRANLELIAAVAEQGDEAFFQHCLALDSPPVGVNTPQAFLVICGIVGCGRLLAAGRADLLPILRSYANDLRWRMREGVVLALQYLGAADMPALLDLMEPWSRGNPFEQRAAAAALCEPKLLTEREHAERVLATLDAITRSLNQSTDRKSEAFQALRKGLGYCWSVAVVAAPEPGKRMIERWLSTSDSDIGWIMRENLAKHRLVRMDAVWVAQAQAQLQQSRLS